MLMFILIGIVTIICWCALSALVYHLLKSYGYDANNDEFAGFLVLISPIGIFILAGLGLGYVVYKKIDTPLNNIINKIKNCGGN